MTRRARVAVAIAALSLLALFALPLWRVDLKAPQYPEGLGLRIWINQVRGATPNGLNSINGLNHYIGMKEIKPESIRELRFMPVIVATLAAAGVGVALWGKRRALHGYAVTLLVVAVCGLIDFWHWEYDYGHDLDPTAAIRIPGMTYQPPLIGGKQLLNFHASSWPAAGGWIAIGAAVVILAVAWKERRVRSHA